MILNWLKFQRNKVDDIDSEVYLKTGFYVCCVFKRCVTFWSLTVFFPILSRFVTFWDLSSNELIVTVDRLLSVRYQLLRMLVLDERWTSITPEK